MEKTMDKIIALAKARGFVYPGSEIYGGLANTWDYGNLGVELKNNVKRAWWQKFIQESPYNVGVDCAILMNPQTWIASGHLGSFSDPLMDCKECHERFRADKIIEDYSQEHGIELESSVDGWSQEEMKNFIEEHNVPCPSCGKHNFTDIRQFNLMFKTFQGVTEDAKNTVYLRPETAQGIFVNFKTFLISGHSDQTIDFPDLPFIEGIDFCCHMGNPVQIFVSLSVFQPLAQLGRHLEIIISALNIFHCRPVFPDHIREKFAFIDFPDLQPQL